MKISSETVEILKNFSTINQSILVKKGKTLSTISSLKTVLAVASIDEDIPQEFALYDLNRFLAKLSLYKECNLDFTSDRINFISSDNKRSDYIKYCSPKVIVTPPDKKLAITPDVTFELKREELEWQRKSAGISGSPNFVFESDGKIIRFISTDVKDDSSDFSAQEIAEGKFSKFKVVMKVENFKMIDGAYTVEISSKGLSRFVHKTRPLEYFIAFEANQSKFN